MKKISLALFITTLYASPSLYAENLFQVYSRAKQYDAQLQAQETNYEATIQNRVIAEAAKKPQVTLSGNASQSYTQTFYDGNMLGDSDTNKGFASGYTLNLTKSLYNPNIKSQVRQADANIAQAAANLEQQRQALIITVAQRYFNLLLAQDTVEFVSAEKESTRQQLAQVKAFFDAGRSAITDVQEAQARYDSVLSQEASANQQLAVAREALRVVTGTNYNSVRAPHDEMPLALPNPSSLDAWVNLARLSNKSLLAQQKTVELSRTGIDLQRTSNSPKVSAFARHTGNLNESDSVLDPRSMGLSVGLEASIPLYTGGANKARIHQARLQYKAAKQTYEYQQRLVEEQVRSAYLTITSTIAQANAAKQALVSAETAAQATQVGFQVGTRTAVDTLTALRNVFSARRDYASARYNYLLNILSLKQAAGTLSDSDLQQLNSILTQPASLKRRKLQKRLAQQKLARQKIMAKINGNENVAELKLTDDAAKPANTKPTATPSTPTTSNQPAATPSRSRSRSNSDIVIVRSSQKAAPKSTPRRSLRAPLLNFANRAPSKRAFSDWRNLKF